MDEEAAQIEMTNIKVKASNIIKRSGGDIWKLILAGGRP
jgi:hypothetical protein